MFLTKANLENLSWLRRHYVDRPEKWVSLTYVEWAQTIRKRFVGNRKHASGRGIEFLLTFEQWVTIWVESGHLGEWGVYKGQYQLARYTDEGRYEVGNVRVLTVEENQEELRTNEKKWRPIMAKAAASRIGGKRSLETRIKMGAWQMGDRNNSKRPEVRAKMSASKKGVPNLKMRGDANPSSRRKRMREAFVYMKCVGY